MGTKQDVYIVAAKRTPIGKFMGGLSSLSAPQLGATAIQGVLNSISLNPEAADEVFMGNVLQAGVGQAPARQAALFAGLPDSVPCTTINKVCASGMKAIISAAQSIALGDAETVIAGGMESMSRAPHFASLRCGQKFGPIQFEDSIQKDGLIDPYQCVAMGIFADQCAVEHHISRQEQDNYAIKSYCRSAKAWKDGHFAEEIVPVKIANKKGEILVNQDEEYMNVNLEKIPTLRPAFSNTDTGTVTAANASTLNDGAAALVLMSKKKMTETGLTPLAKILSYADAAIAPEKFTAAPAKALPLALKKAGLLSENIDLFEINEAFAIVTLVNAKLLGLDLKKVNISGGAVSLGHPIGCSGARIAVTLLRLLNQQNKKYGAAGICNGGGGASAIIFER